MDVNTTVAINILVRTQMSGAVDSFNKALAQMEASARAWANRINRVMGGVNFGGGGGSGVSGASTGTRIFAGFNGLTGQAQYRNAQGRFVGGALNDGAMQAAMRDIERMQRQRAKMESDYTRLVSQQAEKQHQARTKAWTRSAQEFQRISQRGFGSGGGGRGGGGGTGGFGNDFLSNLTGGRSIAGIAAGTLISHITYQFAQIPVLVKQYMDEAINIAKERQNALLSLTSVVGATGGNKEEIFGQIKNLRAVRYGLVDLTDAVIAYRNLRLKLQLDDQQYIDILERTTDTMAFNKQATLTYGEALRRTTEGIRLGISTLSDAGGVVENLDAIIGRYGGDLKDLDDVTKRAAASQQFYKGFLDVTAVALGDADRLTNSYAGSTAKLEAAQRNLSAAIGDIIIQSPEVVAAINTWTFALNDLTGQIKTVDSTAHNSIKSLTTSFGEFSIDFIIGIKKIGVELQELGTVAEYVAHLISSSFWRTFNFFGVFQAGVDQEERLMLDAKKRLGQPTAELRNYENKLRQEYGRNLANQLGAPRGAYNPLFGVPNTGGINAPFQFGGSLQNRKILPFLDFKGPYRNVFNPTAPAGSPPPVSDASDKTKKIDFQLSSRAQALVSAAERLGVSPLDLATLIAYETKGTFSPSIMGGKGGNYMGLIQFGKPERAMYGANANQTFEEQLLGPVVRYFEHRFGLVGKSTAGASLTDLYKAVNAGSPSASIFASDRPGENIGTHVARMLRERRGQALATFFGGDEKNVPSVGRDERELADLAFMLNAIDQMNKVKKAMDAQPITTTQGGAGLDQKVVSRQEMYINGLRESLGLETRIQDLAVRGLALREEINARIEDYNIALVEANVQNKVDLALAQARNVQAEAIVENERKRVEYVTRTKDAERDIAAGRAEDMDAVLTAERRRALISERRLDLEREYRDLSDSMVVDDTTFELQKQVSALRDIVGLRQQERDAILDIHTAQVEIANQTVYSAERANARVLQFMASQKGVTEAMADFKIGLIETGFDLIDKGLDRVLPKMGMFTDAIHELIASFVRLALNAAFRKLFGLDFSRTQGGQGQQQGGGFGGFLSQIFGGQGVQNVGGVGNTGFFGGTAPFNPNAGIGFGGSGVNLSVLQRMLGGGGGNVTTGADLLNGVPIVAGTTASGRQILNPNVVPTASQQGLNIGSGALAFLKNPAIQAQLMGGIAGAGLGMGLGQGSGIGTALGGIGGGLAGILGAGLIQGGVFGAGGSGLFGIAALSGPATLGIGFAVAGVLMLASWLFGRSARKKKEIKEVNRASGDALAQIQKLLADVNAFKIDGDSAVAQAEQIRDQFKESISQLKSGDAKRLANQKLNQMNALIGQIKTAGERADRLREVASITDERLIPTFAAGGFTGMAKQPIFAQLHPNEVVLNAQGIAAMGGYRRLQEAGVRGMGLGDSYERTFRPKQNWNNGASNGQNVYVIGVFDEETADDMVAAASVVGIAKKVKFATKKNVEGLTSTFRNEMAKG